MNLREIGILTIEKDIKVLAAEKNIKYDLAFERYAMLSEQFAIITESDHEFFMMQLGKYF